MQDGDGRHRRARAERVHRRDRGAAARRCRATRSTSRGWRGRSSLALELDEDDRRGASRRWPRRSAGTTSTRGSTTSSPRRRRRSSSAPPRSGIEVSPAGRRGRTPSETDARKEATAMPPRGVKKGSKRARQYEHIKEGAGATGPVGGRGGGDRRPDGQQGTRAARRGARVVPPLARGHLVGAPRRPALAPRAPAAAPATSSTRRPGRWGSRAARG